MARVRALPTVPQKAAVHYFLGSFSFGTAGFIRERGTEQTKPSQLRILLWKERKRAPSVFRSTERRGLRATGPRQRIIPNRMTCENSSAQKL